MQRITQNSVETSQFYQMPKWLFGEEFSELGNDERVAYMLLKERHSLSLKNNWINEENEVFFIYSREELARILGVGKNKVINIFKALKSLNLIEEEKTGAMKPNRIFLLEPNSEVYKTNFMRFAKQTSRGLQNKLHEVCKTNPNNTNKNNTDSSNTELVNCSLKEETTLKVENSTTDEQQTSVDQQIIISDLRAMNIPTTKYVVEIVHEWCELHSCELIQATIDKCVATAKNGVSLNYIKKAIEQLKVQNIKTVDEFKRAEELRSNNNVYQAKNRRTYSVRTEVMPEWGNKEKIQLTDEEQARQLKEIEELMKELK